jgi:MIP family channel proteins
MRDALRHFIAELIGVYALVFFGGGAIMMSRGGSGGLLEIAIAHGLIFGIMVTATMRVSGHLNPAVTAGFLVTRRIEPVMGGVYIIGQLLGAMLAAYTLRAVVPDVLFEVTRGGGQVVSLDITGGQAFALEAIATFFLVFVVFGTAVDPRAPRVGGFAIGLTLTAAYLAIGPLTGASLNPARTFGPAVASGMFEGHMIYWGGPLLGGILAALAYDFIFLPRGTEPHDHGAIRPTAAGSPRVHGT